MSRYHKSVLRLLASSQVELSVEFQKQFEF